METFCGLIFHYGKPPQLFTEPLFFDDFFTVRMLAKVPILQNLAQFAWRAFDQTIHQLVVPQTGGFPVSVRRFSLSGKSAFIVRGFIPAALLSFCVNVKRPAPRRFPNQPPDRRGILEGNPYPVDDMPVGGCAEQRPHHRARCHQTPTSDLLFMFYLLFVNLIVHGRRADHERFHGRNDFEHGMVHARKTAEFARTGRKMSPLRHPTISVPRKTMKHLSHCKCLCGVSPCPTQFLSVWLYQICSWLDPADVVRARDRDSNVE